MFDRFSNFLYRKNISELKSLRDTNDRLKTLITDIASKKTLGDIDSVLQTASNDGLVNFVSQLGTSKDKSFYNTYDLRVLSDLEKINIYRTSWIGGNIVDIPADDATREWRNFIFQDKDGIIDELQQIEEKFDVKNVFNYALKYADVFGGSAILIGIDGAGNNDEPLIIEKIRPGSLKFIHVIDKRYLHALPDGTEQYPGSPNYLNPKYYTTNISPDLGTQNNTFRIHRSRLLKFYGRRMPAFEETALGYWGDSIFTKLFKSISNVDTAGDAIASMIQSANVDIYKVKDLMKSMAMTNGDSNLAKRFMANDTMKSICNSLVIDKDYEDLERKAVSFGSLDSIFQKYIEIISSASGIPATKILGKSADGLNSTGAGDIRNYYDMVSAIQEKKMQNNLNYLDKILAKSELGFIPEDLKYEFNPLWQTPDKEKADIENAKANRDAIYLREGVITPEIVARQLIAEETYQALTEEDIDVMSDFGVSEYFTNLEQENGEQEKTEITETPNDITSY